jgi:hypothetical protein
MDVPVMALLSILMNHLVNGAMNTTVRVQDLSRAEPLLVDQRAFAGIGAGGEADGDADLPSIVRTWGSPMHVDE